MASWRLWSRLMVYGAGICMLAAGGAVRADAVDEREKLAKGVALGVKKRTIWENLYNPRQRDQLYEPIDPLNTVPYKDAGLTIFFSRAGELVHGLGDMLNMKTGEGMIREFLEVKFAAETDVVDPYDLVDDGEFEEDSDEFDAAAAAYDSAVQGRANSVQAMCAVSRV